MYWATGMSSDVGEMSGCGVEDVGESDIIGSITLGPDKAAFGPRRRDGPARDM